MERGFMANTISWLKGSSSKPELEAQNSDFNAVKVHRALKKTPKLSPPANNFPASWKLHLEMWFMPIENYKFYKFKCLKFQNVTSKLGKKPVLSHLMNLFLHSKSQTKMLHLLSKYFVSVFLHQKNQGNLWPHLETLTYTFSSGSFGAETLYFLSRVLFSL